MTTNQIYLLVLKLTNLHENFDSCYNQLQHNLWYFWRSFFAENILADMCFSTGSIQSATTCLQFHLRQKTASPRMIFKKIFKFWRLHCKRIIYEIPFFRKIVLYNCTTWNICSVLIRGWDWKLSPDTMFRHLIIPTYESK